MSNIYTSKGIWNGTHKELLEQYPKNKYLYLTNQGEKQNKTYVVPIKKS